MSPLKSDTATTTLTSKKQSTNNLIDDLNRTTANTKTNKTINNDIPTPPIIKINRKYSRLSLNSSYESLPESRAYSSAGNTTPSSHASRSR